MSQKIRVSSFVLLLLLLSARASFAVTVPGYDGTSLPLSQIPDIIRHVTGQTSGDLNLKKDSLFMYGVRSGGHEDMNLYSFNSDGSNVDSASASSPRNNPSNYDYSQISAVNTSTKLDDRGRLLLLYLENGSIQGKGAFVSADNGSAAGIEYRNRHHDSGSENGYLVGTKSGITVKGYDGELVAFLRRNGETFSLNLGKFQVSASSDQAIARTDLLECSWSGTTGSSGNVPKMLDGTIYYPLSMAAGDFDNDGYANEIAVIDTNRIAVHYHVLQISHTGSTSDDAKFSISVLNNGNVDTYNYGNWDLYYTNHYLNMDGFSTIFSLCTVAGDFDGDGQTEFAVVYRDTSPQDALFTRRNNSYPDWTGFYAYNDFTMFSGYTGHIHVKIYKWDGSGFQAEEDSRAFDMHKFTFDVDRKMYWHDIDLPLGVKAAVGDFDGDGRDDIAVLRVMLQCTELVRPNGNATSFSFSNYVFGAFVDWYTFDYGSIKPKYNAHSQGSHPWNYGDNANGWVGIRAENIWLTNNFFDKKYTDDLNNVRRDFYLKPLTGEDKPYPVIDREFDIIAGKFSGQIGKAVTRDDLIIKYPQWSDSDGNKLRSHVVLMTNIPGVTNWGTEVHEITSLSDRDHLLAFAKADYLGEGVTLGDPVKVTDTSDLDYTAILQMFPYHVDNLTSDGTALQKDPQNFTLRLGTAVTYNNTSSSSETKNLTYSMIKTAETIFALDNPALRTASKTFQGIRGITTAVLGDNDKIKKMDGIGKIWDKLKDTTQTTTTKSNENSTSYTMSITTSANYQDTLYMNQSNRYIWRYPIQEVPAPAWLIGENKDTSASFDASQAMNQRSYITFAMSEPAMPTSAVGINDSHYHPY
ncbi:MAG: hypothetical protein IJ587_02450, partial [Synergistaceae bacterium]|nr:hypothetical protein [Synergistaceae bacterium]